MLLKMRVFFFRRQNLLVGILNIPASVGEVNFVDFFFVNRQSFITFQGMIGCDFLELG